MGYWSGDTYIDDTGYAAAPPPTSGFTMAPYDPAAAMQAIYANNPVLQALVQQNPNVRSVLDPQIARWLQGAYDQQAEANRLGPSYAEGWQPSQFDPVGSGWAGAWGSTTDPKMLNELTASINSLGDQNLNQLWNRALAQNQAMWEANRSKFSIPLPVMVMLGLMGAGAGGMFGAAGAPGGAAGGGAVGAGLEGAGGIEAALAGIPAPQASTSLADYGASQGLTGGQGFQMTPSAANAFDTASGLQAGASTGGQGFSLPTGAANAFGGSYTAGGMAPVDYSMTAGSNLPSQPGLDASKLGTANQGLQMPTSPNIPGMGGGQGLTVPLEGGGTVAEGGTFGPGYTPDLGGGKPTDTDFMDRVRNKLMEKGGKWATERLFAPDYEYTEGAARYDQGTPSSRGNIFKMGNLTDLFSGDIDAIAEAALRELGFSVGRQSLQESSIEGEQVAGVEEEASKYYQDVEQANREAQEAFNAASIEAALAGLAPPATATAAEFAMEPPVPTFSGLNLVMRGGTPLPTKARKKGAATGASAPVPGEEYESEEGYRGIGG